MSSSGFGVPRGYQVSRGEEQHRRRPDQEVIAASTSESTVFQLTLLPKGGQADGIVTTAPDNASQHSMGPSSTCAKTVTFSELLFASTGAMSSARRQALRRAYGECRSEALRLQQSMHLYGTTATAAGSGHSSNSYNNNNNTTYNATNTNNNNNSHPLAGDRNGMPETERMFLSGNLTYPPVSAAVVASAATQLCRPYVPHAHDLWAEATDAAKSFWQHSPQDNHSQQGHHTSNTTTTAAPRPPPYVDTSTVSPQDDDVLSNMLMLDVLLTCADSIPTAAASRRGLLGARGGAGVGGLLSVTDAEWVISKYLDAILLQLDEEHVTIGDGESQQRANSGTTTEAEHPPHITNSGNHHDRNNTNINGKTSREAYFNGLKGRCPSGFYDSLLEEATEAHNAPLAALDKYLTDMVANSNEATTLALRKAFLAQRALTPSAEGSMGSATANKGIAGHGGGVGVIAQAATVASAAASEPLGPMGSLSSVVGGHHQQSKGGPLARAASATAAAVTSSASLLANSCGLISESISRASALLKQARGEREVCPLTKGGSRLDATVNELYSQLFNQLLLASKDRERQEKGGGGADDANTPSESSSATASSSAFRLKNNNSIVAMNNNSSMAPMGDGGSGRSTSTSQSPYATMVTAALSEAQRQGGVHVGVGGAGLMPFSLPSTSGIESSIQGTGGSSDGCAGRHEESMARLFVVINVLRRLAAFGLSAFTASGGGVGVDSPLSTPTHQQSSYYMYAECFNLLRTHAPEIMPIVAERLRAKFAASIQNPIVSGDRKTFMGAGIGDAVPPNVKSPVESLLANAVARSPQLSYLASVLHHHASSIPTLANSSTTSLVSLSSTFNSQSHSSYSRGGEGGSGGVLEDRDRALVAVSGSKEGGTHGGAIVPLPTPKNDCIEELMNVLNERVGDAHNSDKPLSSGADKSNHLEHNLKRLLARNAALERENEALRKGLLLQSKALQQAVSGASTTPSVSPATPDSQPNPLVEMATVHSQLIKTLHDVTAALKASRSSLPLHDL